MRYNVINRNLFEDLLVLAAPAPAHGGLAGLLRVVQDFGRVVRYNNVRTAIKLPQRDLRTSVHPRFLERRDLPGVRDAADWDLPREAVAALLETIRRHGCVRMAGPGDERAIQQCVELGVEILKVESADAGDWALLDALAATRKPVIVDTGGQSMKHLDDLVTFFTNRDIPLALNHCVLAPEPGEPALELNQVDFLRGRYPDLTIGLSTREDAGRLASLYLAYAKGARTFERWIGVQAAGAKLPSWCSTPEQVDQWFKALKKAKAMCGAPGTQKRIPAQREIQYLDSLVRGIYAARDLPAGTVLSGRDFYMSVPLQKGQISCRELVVDDRLVRPVGKDEPITIDHLDNVYSVNPELRALILARGL